MINNISIKTKLLILLFIPLLTFAGTAIYLLQLNSSNITKLTNVLYETTNRATTLVLNADRDMYQAFSGYQRIQSQFFSEQDKDLVVKDFNENVTQVNERIQQALHILKEQQLTQLAHSDSGKSIDFIMADIDLLFNQWAEQAIKNIQQAASSAAVESQLHTQFEDARENINQFGEILEVYALSEVDEINQDKAATTTAIYLILGLACALLTVFGFIIIRKITSTVTIVQLKTKQVSEGILQYHPQKTYDKDELGQILFSVDYMIDKMRELIGKIASNSQLVASASNELSASARESTSAAVHVAENIQEVTSLVDVQSTITDEASKAMVEMSVGVQRIAESTNRISEHSGQTNEQADQGTDLLRMLKDQMQQMMETIQKMNHSVNQLNEKSARIGAITDNITGFANQTSILSLNASIEAARAGEHGKGFAVVASEIRKLATNSLESAQVITDLIADTRDEIDQASSFMNDTLVQSQRGTSIMDDVAQGFDAIVQSIKQVTEQIHDTSAVTEQMSASSEEVSAGMEQSSSSAREIAAKAQSVAAATEEQLALVESISDSADQLNKIVSSLNESVRYFKL
jgi:methyl-accepting chemotaxis protein